MQCTTAWLHIRVGVNPIVIALRGRSLYKIELGVWEAACAPQPVVFGFVYNWFEVFCRTELHRCQNT